MDTQRIETTGLGDELLRNIQQTSVNECLSVRFVLDTLIRSGHNILYIESWRCLVVALLLCGGFWGRSHFFLGGGGGCCCGCLVSGFLVVVLLCGGCCPGCCFGCVFLCGGVLPRRLVI